MFSKVRNISIALDFLKGEKELIVFLHGVGADRTSWKYQLKYFNSLGYSVAAIDMRGSGDSDARDKDGNVLPISLKEFALDVDAVIKELGYQKAHWVGNSKGGVIILQAIELGLTTLDKIVLGNTFAYHTDKDVILPRAQAALETKTLPEFAKERIPLVFKPDIDKETLGEAIYAMARKDKDAYLASWQATWSPDFRSLLGSIKNETLVISGSIDKITPVALSDELAAGITGSKHVCIEGAGHIAHADQPEDYNKAVKDFLI
ncbi:MAG TPA: alpha/beta hydrolase [Candidatus Kapabacteria bacterium]